MRSARCTQIWNREKLVSSIELPLSMDAAREIARALPPSEGWYGRIFAEGEDYVEVWSSDGSVRTGTFAHTTLVHVTND